MDDHSTLELTLRACTCTTTLGVQHLGPLNFEQKRAGTLVSEPAMASALLALLALGALGAEPLGRYSHCAVHLGSDMYIHGGRGFASTGDKRNLVLFG